MSKQTQFLTKAEDCELRAEHADAPDLAAKLRALRESYEFLAATFGAGKFDTPIPEVAPAE